METKMTSQYKIIKKTRKIHRCDICYRRIPKGFSAHFYTGINNEGEFFNCYLCNTCETLTEEFPDAVLDWHEGYFDTQTLYDSMSEEGVSTPLQLLNKLRKEKESS